MEQKNKWIRYRFYSRSWKPKKGMESNKNPYWISGQTAYEPTHYTIVAWLPFVERLSKHWRVSQDHPIDATEHAAINFSDRFPKPEGFDDGL